MDLETIRNALPGFHVEINLFPSGGDIYAMGCEECGTEDEAMFVAGWRARNGENAKDALENLRKQCGLTE